MVPLQDPDESTWRALRDDVEAHVDDILHDWERITTEEPWMSLPEHYRLDHLPTVTRTLCNAALTASGGSSEAYRRFVWAAAEHGQMRRQQGFPRDLLFTEHYLLREAIWHYITVRHLARSAQAVLQLDAAITFGARGSLIGFHRTEFEARGRWPTVVEELVGQTPAHD